MFDLILDKDFDFPNDSYVFEILPAIYSDSRGSFSEVLKIQENASDMPSEAKRITTSFTWIKQVNRSVSRGSTIRGCHAQSGKYCQGKLVEALNEKIFDIITDARPDSQTFGMSKAYILDPKKQNKLWVPRGFLHSFAVPKNAQNAIFQYFCDNMYNKQSEVHVNPMSLLLKAISHLKEIDFTQDFKDLYELFDETVSLSDADKNAQGYESWMKQVKNEYLISKKLWYKD